MEVSSTNPSVSQTVPNSAADQQTKKEISSDFETFIKMLTTQMQNQDPLNPIESADFAVQLATFSSVEQQVKTNDLLTSLADRVAGLGVAQLAGWVGMTARANMPVAFDGISPVSLTVRAPAGADRAELVVKDSTGVVVSRGQVPAESAALEWPGLDDSGALLPEGTYTISLDTYKGDEFLESTPVEIHDRIVEARKDSGQTILVMSGGHEISADDILGLRESVI